MWKTNGECQRIIKRAQEHHKYKNVGFLVTLIAFYQVKKILQGSTDDIRPTETIPYHV